MLTTFKIMYLLIIEFGYGILAMIAVFAIIYAVTNIPTMISNWRFDKREKQRKDNE